MIIEAKLLTPLEAELAQTEFEIADILEGQLLDRWKALKFIASRVCNDEQPFSLTQIESLPTLLKNQGKINPIRVQSEGRGTFLYSHRDLAVLEVVARRAKEEGLFSPGDLLHTSLLRGFIRRLPRAK